VASDHLGTPLATLNLDTGAVLGEQLRAPYGQARYAASAQTNGGMHTTYGFTGQREDASAAGSSGLDYFNARYYDPVVGRFTAADSATGADPLLDGYAYVGGPVESATDPSGHQTMTLQGGFSVGAGAATAGIGILGFLTGVAIGVVAGGIRDIGNGQTANITVYSNGNVNVEIDGSDGFEVNSNTYGPGSAGYAKYMALLSDGTAVTTAVLTQGILNEFRATHHAQSGSGDSGHSGDNSGGKGGNSGSSSGGTGDSGSAGDTGGGGDSTGGGSGSGGNPIDNGGGGAGNSGSGGGAGAGGSGGAGSNYPGEYLSQKAPTYSTPNSVMDGTYVDDLGRPQPWRAWYDQFGRLTARTDYNAGNASQGIPDVHYHTYLWDDVHDFHYMELESHVPGEFEPSHWPLWPLG